MHDETLAGLPSDVYKVNLSAQLIDQILAKLPPLLAEGLFLAAVPHSYDAALIKAMRARDDGRDEKLVERLAQFSFVTPVGEDEEAGLCYRLMEDERDILNRRWIARDPQAYVEAHRRALAFRETQFASDPFRLDQSRLDHLLIIDCPAGLEHLRRVFQSYAAERRFAVAERLLSTAAEARAYLALLGSPHLAELDDWLAYMQARMAQLQGSWTESLASLKVLIDKLDIPFNLLPYAARAYGLGLANQGSYVEAIEQYEFGLDLFSRQPASESEQAFTMIDLGNAHVDLAISARGQREVITPCRRGLSRVWQWLGDVLSFWVSLPIVIYLSSYFGLRVWDPRCLPMLRGQDWVIARLFGIGARWNRKADRLLQRVGNQPERAQTAEKLAYLHLMMGDAALAARLYRSLVEEQDIPLSEYRLARARAGLGQALLRQGQAPAALEHLERALPVIQAYEDFDIEAKARGLMAEAMSEVGRSAEALQQFTRAMHLYQKQNDLVGATEVAERMQAMGQTQQLSSQDREQVSTTSQELARRQYLVRFSHPALVVFRRAALILLGLLTFLLPVLTIQVESGSSMVPEIRYLVAPLLSPDPTHNPSVSQNVVLNVQAPQADVAGQVIVVLVLGYLLIYTALGLMVMARTRLETVQAAQARAVRWNLKGLSVGRGEAAESLAWPEVSELFIADVNAVAGPMADNSSLAVAAGPKQLAVTGNTAWYTNLRDRLRLFASGARAVDLSYSVIRSKMGVLYALSAACLLVVGVLWQVRPGLVSADLLGSPYSVLELYPYLYLGLFVALGWWIVARPLYTHAHLYPRSGLIELAGGSALILVVLHWLSFPRAWLFRPDIYPPLAAIILAGSLLAAIWLRRSQSPPPEASLILGTQWARLLVSAVAVVLVVAAGLRLWREGSAYHNLAWANTQRDQGIAAQNLGQVERATSLLEKAVASYTRALAILPGDATILNGRATALAWSGRYEAAIADYDALRGSPKDGALRLNRGWTHLKWAEALAKNGHDQAAASQFEQARADFDHLVELEPDNATYYVWRGLTYHLQDDWEPALQDYQLALERAPQSVNALMGQGWVYFQLAHQAGEQAKTTKDKALEAELQAKAQRTFTLALISFQTAARYSPNSPEIWLAVGYAYYRLGLYQDTLEAWNQAAALAPQDPAMFISRASAHWALARPAGNDCYANDETATEAEIAEALSQMNQAIDDLNRALVTRPDDHYTYWTRGQLEWMLRKCPGYDRQEQLRKTIASYSLAIEHAPQVDRYWQYRARVKYELGSQIFNEGPGREAEARQVLDEAMADITQAYALAPDGSGNRTWRDYLAGNGWGDYYGLRGLNYYNVQDYGLAQKDFEATAELEAHDVWSAFKSGLAALALEQIERAAGWYDEGLRRASQPEAAGAAGAIKTGLDDLVALAEARPGLAEAIEPIRDKLQKAYDSLVK
ncbi:MAG: tetratricopeptide repeat protein [Thermoflexales bacterium]|nr:tetratricopeptide repeat protein [Thermoflexales bacterium]